MKLKPGVRVTSLSPQILLAICVADGLWAEQFSKNLTVTSICDGQHSHNSLHWIGHAVDLRTRDLDQVQQQVAHTSLQAFLGEDYDVILESDHIHIEFQPHKR